MDDVTGMLGAANAAVKLVGTVARVAPLIQNATQGQNRLGAAGNVAFGQPAAAGTLPGAMPFDNEQERRAYEKVNMVLRNVGERLVKSGLADQAALNRALTAVTQHVDVQLFSVENNKLFQSLANRLNDAELVNNVFTSIYLFAFLTSELQSSLPNYKTTYIPLGQRMIQQLFKVALGLDAFKDNLAANLQAYKTLAMTAGMLKPLDIDVTVFRNFPSFTISKYSSKSYGDTSFYKKAYNNLVGWFYANGFPQPLQGRDAGPIRNWAFLSGDTNTHEFDVERADKHIGENFGRVLYWLLCMANRLNEGSAVIVYHEQHIALVRWLGTRFGYRVLNAATDLNMIPHSQMKPKYRAIFNTWVVITPSQTILQMRKDTAAALTAQGLDPTAAARAAAQQTEEQALGFGRPANVPPVSPVLANPAAAQSPAAAQAQPQSGVPEGRRQSRVSSADASSVMSDPILSHIAAKQAEQRVSEYTPSLPSAHDEDAVTAISSEGHRPYQMSAPELPQSARVRPPERSSQEPPSSAYTGQVERSSHQPLSTYAHPQYQSSQQPVHGAENTRSGLPSSMPTGNRTNSTSLVDRLKQLGISNMADAQTVPSLSQTGGQRPQAGVVQRTQTSPAQRLPSYDSSGMPPLQHTISPESMSTPVSYGAPMTTPPKPLSGEVPTLESSVPHGRYTSPSLHQPSIGSVAELQAMSATMSGPAELADTYHAAKPTSFDHAGASNARERSGTNSSRPGSIGGASIATTTALKKPRRKAPPPPKVIQAVAKHDFEPEEEDGDELAFFAGDLIEIVSKTKELEEDGWCQIRIKGSFKVGLAPLDYLEELPTPKLKAPPAPKAPAAPPAAEPAPSQPAFDAAPKIPTPDFGPESSRSLDPPLNMSEVSADPPEHRPSIPGAMSEGSSISALSPPRDSHMQSPPTFLPYPGTVPSARGRGGKDMDSAQRDVSPMAPEQLDLNQARLPVAEDEAATPTSYQPPAGPPPSQQPREQQRQQSGPATGAAASYYAIPSPTSEQVNRLQQRPNAAGQGAAYDYYSAATAAPGDAAHTAQPASYASYSTAPLAYAAGAAAAQGYAEHTQPGAFGEGGAGGSASFAMNPTLSTSNKIENKLEDNSVHNKQKQNKLDLSGANISLFNDHSVHQNQSVDYNDNSYNSNNNNDNTDYGSPGEYVVVDPAMAASPLGALAPGYAGGGYFEEASYVDTGVAGVSPLAGLAPSAGMYTETATATETDVYVDAQGDVAVETTTVQETDTAVVEPDGTTYVEDDTAVYQSYVEDDADTGW